MDDDLAKDMNSQDVESFTVGDVDTNDKGAVTAVFPENDIWADVVLVDSLLPA